MASSDYSSPHGPSSPDAHSSPIPNTNSSPFPPSSSSAGRRRRRRRRSATPSAAGPDTPRVSPSPFSTPSTTRAHRRPAPPTTPTTPASSSAGDDDPADAPPVFVWGTNISVQDVNAAVLRFIRHFRDPRARSSLTEEGKYMRAVHRIMELEGGESLDVDAHDVFDYDPDLYTKMVRYPLEVLAIFDIVIMDMVARIDPLFEKHIQTRIFNLKSSVSMRSLNPSGAPSHRSF